METSNLRKWSAEFIGTFWLEKILAGDWTPA